MVLLFAACEDDDFVLEEDWEPTYESLSELQPILVSKKQFESTVRDNFYTSRLYHCSDSLGKMYFWPARGKCTCDIIEGEYNYWLCGHNPSLCKILSDNTCYHYTFREPLLEPKRRISYWYYDGKDGKLGRADLSLEWAKQYRYYTLMKLTKDYIVLRRELSSPDGTRASAATYALHIYKVTPKSVADRYWHTEVYDEDQ